MKAPNLLWKSTAVAICAGWSLFLAFAADADTLTFDATPAANAVAEMSQKYGVGIVFRGNVDASRPVTFSIADADTPDGRLQAISTLASSLGLRFQKTYVVSKIDVGATVPETKIDSTGKVGFAANQVSAQEAIQTVAAADAATAQVSAAITGDVTFPHTLMTVRDAAAEIAKQTGTQWKAYYALYPRGQEPQRLEGRIVDYTKTGRPILELPLVTYQTPTPPVETVSAPQATQTTTSAMPTNPNMNPYAAANGYNPYGYNPYAYNPYGYTNPYGYGADPYNNGGGMGAVTDSNGAGLIPIQGGFGQPTIYTVPNNGLPIPPVYNGPVVYNGSGYYGY